LKIPINCLLNFMKSNRMKTLLLSFSILFFFISCKQESPASTFQKDGVSLKIPQGWKITDEDAFDDFGYYLAIEKDGFDSSGLMTITWVKDSLDLKTSVTAQQNEMRDISVYEKANLKFESIASGSFNGITTSDSNFTMSMMGVDHIGEIQSFYERGKTFTILKQEAVEDVSDNASGYLAIEKGFNTQ